jgi:hypothetical protein
MGVINALAQKTSTVLIAISAILLMLINIVLYAKNVFTISINKVKNIKINQI